MSEPRVSTATGANPEASQAASRIRVLSGLHAGAFLDWTTSELRLGAEENVDVHLEDWPAATLCIRTPEGADADRTWPFESEGRPGQPGAAGSLRCWVPQRFGNVILCVGPAHAAWPSDVELLERLFVPAEPPVPAAAPKPEVDAPAAPEAQPLAEAPAAPARSRFRSTAALVSLALALVMLAPLLPWNSAQRRAEAAAPPPLPLAQRVGLLLKGVEVQALVVKPDGAGVRLQGVLPAASKQRLDRALDALDGGDAVARQYLSEEELRQRVTEACAPARVTLHATEPGHWTVRTTAADTPVLRRAIADLQRDLAPLGLKLRADLQAAEDVPPALRGRLIGAGGSSYVRTTDGAKHIVPGTTTDTVASTAP